MSRMCIEKTLKGPYSAENDTMGNTHLGQGTL